MSVDGQIILFADDCLISLEINYLEDKRQLQKDIDSLQYWAETRVFGSTHKIATFSITTACS